MKLQIVGRCCGIIAFLLTFPVLADEPMRVSLSLGSEPYRVGQPIRLRVAVTAGARRPELTAPEIPDALLYRLGTGLAPISTTGIGRTIDETNRYLFDFWLVPQRAGTLTLPPFRVTLAANRGASPIRRLEVRPLPPAGRTSAFLGGVGQLDSLNAEAHPGSVRVGQTFDYTLRLEGSAALGSTGRPTLVRLERTGWAAEVEALADVVVASPPSRTYRWRLRPLRAGEASVPPVSVSWFDPESGHYQTRIVGAVPVRVVDVARFHPSLPEAGPTIDARTRGHWWAVTAVSLTILTTALALIRVVRRAIRKRRADAGQLAFRLAGEIELAEGLLPLATRIEAALAEYLAFVAARPRGVLTPVEAAEGIRRVSRQEALGRRARLLMEACDRIRYGGGEGEAPGLAKAARDFFEELARG